MTQQIISTPLDQEPELAEEETELEAGAETRALAACPEDHGDRIDRFLARSCPAFSRSYFQQLLEEGAVALNGQPVSKPATRLKTGDRVEVELRPTAQAQSFLPEAMALQVVYEDEHLMVVDKPAGLVVHPAAGNWTGTLLNGLLAHHGGAARLPRAGIVHRLDKDTSGLMIVGKTQQAVDALVRMIARREVHRIYVALAHGGWRGASEVLVDQPIGRDPRNRLRMAVLQGASGAKEAQTRVRLLDAGGGLSWVGCKLHTGRTHQIRVHMAWLGHPLVGDTLYGGRALAGMGRQALHALRLVFVHPVTGVTLSLESRLPPDIHAALQNAGLHYNFEQLWRVDPA
ncbi:RluA family pseudouridine synthase [Hydrogenophaga aquatica]